MRKRFRFLSVLFLLLLAGTLALTQDFSSETPGAAQETMEKGSGQTPEFDFVPEPEFEIPAPPPPDWVHGSRWFRSNAGGMALEEIPSPFAALRNEYTLLVEFVGREELPEKLLPFYDERYFIEIRVLYENGDEARKQWIFRDENGLNRLVAVLNEPPPVTDETLETPDDDPALDDPSSADPAVADPAPVTVAADTIPQEAGAAAVADPAPVTAAADAIPQEADSVADAAAAGEGDAVSDEIADSGDTPDEETPALTLSGFIEVYTEQYLLEKEVIFYDNGEERETGYFYTNETLVRAETNGRIFQDGNKTAAKLFTDSYRYNRSHSLRSVERLYHDRVEENTVRLAFPNRVLDAAADDNFIGEQLHIASDFFGSYTAEEGQRMVFTTDERGRILTQTLIGTVDVIEEDEPAGDEPAGEIAEVAADGESGEGDTDGEAAEGVKKKDVEIWTIKNTWENDRIVSAEKVEGDDIRLHEYEYSSGGDLVEERNYHNGILERQVRITDGREVEELFINGIAALRAVWEDGRKISEERLHPREQTQ